MKDSRGVPAGHRWRFFVEPGPLAQGDLLLGPGESRYAKVLRLRPGESIELADGAGRVASGRVFNSQADAVGVQVDEPVFYAAPLLPIVLILGLAKQAALEEACESAAQLGASHIGFVASLAQNGHRVGQGGGGDEASLRPKDAQRLKRIVYESDRIAKSPWHCQVSEAVLSPKQLAGLAAARCAVVLVCDEAPLHEHTGFDTHAQNWPHLTQALRGSLAQTGYVSGTAASIQSIVLVIGPESGFSDSDKEQMKSAAAEQGVPLAFVSLGPRILTVPNAARAAVVLADALRQSLL